MRFRRISAIAFAAVLCYAVLSASAQTSFHPLLVRPSSSGTVTLPDPDSVYVSAEDIHSTLAPPGGEEGGGKGLANVKLEHRRFRDIRSTSGGIFRGGTIETFDSILGITVEGLPGGPLEGITVDFEVPASAEVHSEPQGEGAVRTFKTTMNSLTGRVVDPNNVFERFEVLAGDEHGFPSPGVTTLIQQEDGSFLVDSRFDIGFQLYFVGSPDGPLAGFEDEIEGRVTVVATSVEP